MAGLPANVNYGTVTGKLLTAEQVASSDPQVDGVAVVGKVTFTPSVSRIIHSVAKTLIAPKPIVVNLGADGSFTTMLVATDDPDLNPTGWTYEVKFDLTGVSFQSFHISVPSDQTVDLATLTPVPSASGTYYLVGPEGPPGVQNLFVQSTAPTSPALNDVWIQI